jgi:hypothetical protein
MFVFIFVSYSDTSLISAFGSGAITSKYNDLLQVLLPTGTMVDISFRAWPISTVWQLDITIYPSASDVGRTRGLCGVLGGGTANDFTRRDGSVDNPTTFPDDFSNSWL